MKERITNRLVKSIEPREKPFEVADVDLPGFLMRVQSSGVMTFYARYRLPQGGQGRVRIGRVGVLTVAQAREQARQTLADVVQGLDPGEAKRAGKSHTLGTFLHEVYAPWYIANTKEGEAAIKRIRSACEDLLPKRLSEINAWLVERWRAKRLKGKRKPRTVNKDLGYLRALLGRAQGWGFIEAGEHPLRQVKATREDRSKKVRFLSPEEETRLRSALETRAEGIRQARDRHNEWLRERDHEPRLDLRTITYVDFVAPLVLLVANTGIRRGEAFHLSWGDINFEHTTLTVTGAVAKSAQTRHIPLNSEALEVLRTWKNQASHAKDGDLVFPSRDGKPFGHIRKTWASLMKEAKIVGFRFHDLRHHFASKLTMRGIDLNVTRELLGHSDLKTTMIYAHLSPEVKASAVEALVDDGNVLAFPAANGQQT